MSTGKRLDVDIHIGGGGVLVVRAVIDVHQVELAQVDDIGGLEAAVKEEGAEAAR